MKFQLWFILFACLLVINLSVSSDVAESKTKKSVPGIKKEVEEKEEEPKHVATLSFPHGIVHHDDFRVAKDVSATKKSVPLVKKVIEEEEEEPKHVATLSFPHGIVHHDDFRVAKDISATKKSVPLVKKVIEEKEEEEEEEPKHVATLSFPHGIVHHDDFRAVKDVSAQQQQQLWQQHQQQRQGLQRSKLGINAATDDAYASDDAYGSDEPTVVPTAVPSTAVPSEIPTAVPTAVPSITPTAVPSAVPTKVPSTIPTKTPSAVPSVVPTAVPTAVPSVVPSTIPSKVPTKMPSAVPTPVPTTAPSLAPTAIPTATRYPTQSPNAYNFIFMSVKHTFDNMSSFQQYFDTDGAKVAVSISVANAIDGVSTVDVTQTTPIDNTVTSTSGGCHWGVTAKYVIRFSPFNMGFNTNQNAFDYVSNQLTWAVGNGTFDDDVHSYGALTGGLSVVQEAVSVCLEIEPVYSIVQPSMTPTRAPTVVPTKMPTQAPTLVPSIAPSATPNPTLRTLAPTVSPTLAPTVTPQPTKVPTLVPSAMPTLYPSAVPTLAPNHLHYLLFQAFQSFVNTNGCFAYINNPTAQQALFLAIAASLRRFNVQAEDIRGLSVICGLSDLIANSTTSNRRRLQTDDLVNSEDSANFTVVYGVEFSPQNAGFNDDQEAFDEVIVEILAAVDSGSFDADLQFYADVTGGDAVFTPASKIKQVAVQPTFAITVPSIAPTAVPSMSPVPSIAPTFEPSGNPSRSPTANPTYDRYEQSGQAWAVLTAVCVLLLPFFLFTIYYEWIHYDPDKEKRKETYADSLMTLEQRLQSGKGSKRALQTAAEEDKTYADIMIDSLPKSLTTPLMTDALIQQEMYHNEWLTVFFDGFERVKEIAKTDIARPTHSVRIGLMSLHFVLVFFFLSLFWERLYKDDDGSCSTQKNQLDCESDDELYPYSYTYKCIWDGSKPPGAKCQWRNADDDIRGSLFIAVWVSWITYPLMKLAYFLVQIAFLTPTKREMNSRKVMDSSLMLAVSDESGSFKSTKLPPKSPNKTRVVGEDTLFAQSAKASLRRKSVISGKEMEYSNISKFYEPDVLSQFAVLNEELTKYRKTFSVSDPARALFDASWRLDSFGKFRLNIKNSKKRIGSKKFPSIFRHIQSIQEAEALEQYYIDLGIFNIEQIERRMLMLFHSDLLSGKRSTVLRYIADKEYVLRAPVAKWVQSLAVLFMLVSAAACVVYTVLYAVREDYMMQRAWVYSLFFWVMMEFFVVQPLIVAIIHVFIPFALKKFIDTAVSEDSVQDALLQDEEYSINQHSYTAGQSAAPTAERDAESGSSAVIFNAARFLFIASRLAEQFPSFTASKIISRYSTPYRDLNIVIQTRIQEMADASNSVTKSRWTSCKLSVASGTFNFLNWALQYPVVFELILGWTIMFVAGALMLALIELYWIHFILPFLPFLLLLMVFLIWYRSEHDALRKSARRMSLKHQKTQQEVLYKMAQKRRQSMKSGESSKLRDSVRIVGNSNSTSSPTIASPPAVTAVPSSSSDKQSLSIQPDEPAQLPSYLLGLLWSTKLVEEHGTVDKHTGPVQEVTSSVDPGYRLNRENKRISDVFLKAPTTRNKLDPLNVEKKINSPSAAAADTELDSTPSNVLSVKLKPGQTADLWESSSPVRKAGAGGNYSSSRVGPTAAADFESKSPYSTPPRKSPLRTDERLKSPTNLWNPSVRDSRRNFNK